MKKIITVLLSALMLLPYAMPILADGELAVSFTASDGDVVSLNELSNFKVTAYNAESVELFADDISVGKLTEASEDDAYIFEIIPNHLGKLKLKAVAERGEEKKEYSATVNCVKPYEKSLLFRDFENYKSGQKPPFSQAETNNNGEWGPKKYDDNHGTSMQITAYPGLYYDPWFGYNMSATTDDITLKWDYICSNTENNLNIFLRNGGNGFYAFRIKNGDFDGINNGILFDNIFEPNKWYNITINLHTKESAFDVTVIDEESGDAYNTSGIFKSNILGEMAGFRFFCTRNADMNAQYGFDNFSIIKSGILPYVKEIGENGDADHTLDYIPVRFNSRIETPSTEDITLENEIGPVGIKDIEAENDDASGETVIKIYPEWKSSAKLEPSCRYTVTFSGNLKSSDGIEYELPMVSDFKTTSKDFDIIDGTFEYSKDGNIRFKAEIQNLTADEKQFILIIPVFENGVLQKLITKTDSISSGETVWAQADVTGISTESMLKAFITDVSYIPVSNKIYVYNNK